MIVEAYPELIDVQSMISWTPAMFACRNGYKDILQYLHQNGAQLERERGYSAIHAACFGGDPDILRYLLEDAKVNPNPDTYDRIPIYISLDKNVRFILINII